MFQIIALIKDKHLQKHKRFDHAIKLSISQIILQYTMIGLVDTGEGHIAIRMRSSGS